MNKNQIKIRELMPRGYAKVLQDRTGKTLAYIYTVVNSENTNAEMWPEVLKLAQETQNQRQKQKEQLIKLKAA